MHKVRRLLASFLASAALAALWHDGRGDYQVTFTPEERALLRKIFPTLSAYLSTVRVADAPDGNGKPAAAQRGALMPETIGKYQTDVNGAGGGVSAQAAAIRHGITRALLQVDPELRPTLKKAGFITRDSREVERKKVGLHGARRRKQFSKR